jgi:O-antigen/teichoic acid export membrane protein
MNVIAKLRSDLNKLKDSPELKKSVIYVVASTIGYGIVFVQNFSLAYLLSISFFGKISLIISLFSTLYVLYTFGLNAVVLRYHFDKKFNTDERKLVSHITAIWFLLGGALTIIFLLLGYKFIAIDHVLQIDFYSEFLFILGAAFFFSFGEIFPNFFIAREKPYHYAAFLIAGKALLFVFLLAGVYFFGESSHHFSLMMLCSSLLLFLVGAVVFKIFPIVRLSVENLKELLVYAFPLMLYALGGIGYSHGYRVIISSTLNPQDLAVFAIAAQLASMYNLAAVSSVTGLYTKAFKRLEESNGHPHAIRFYLRALIYIGIGLLAIVLPALYVFLLYFKGGAFMGAFKILPILMLGQFVFFIYSYNYILCTYYKKTNVLSYSMFTGVITSLALAFILINGSNITLAAIPVTTGLIVQFLVSLFAIKMVVKRTHYVT